MAEPGQWVGGFRLVRELGSGGFGTVHLGEDASGRRAAVKLLHPHLAADPQVRRYFAQELVNARKVQGFCLAEVLDGDAEADPPWIATEYIDGPTLAQAVRQDGPRTGGDLQRLAVQTITALNAVHAAGVVHRDLKPANILLAPDGPRVIDFGIARALDADTSTPTRIGTLGYMAPEQIEGTTLGPSADLFAWGAVIVYAATGAEAFPGPTQVARINRVLTQPPETGDLTGPLLGIVLVCTAKDPADRPSARQVWDMLLTGRATPPASSQTPFSGFEDEDELYDAEAELRRAKAGDVEAMFSVGVDMELEGRLEEAEHWFRKGAEGGDSQAQQGLVLLLHNADRLEEVELWCRRAADERWACSMLANLLQDAGRLEEAERWYHRVIEKTELDAAPDLEFQQAFHSLGVLAEDSGRLEEAEHWFRKGAETGYVSSAIALALLLRKAKRREEAKRWETRARNLLDAEAARRTERKKGPR